METAITTTRTLIDEALERTDRAAAHAAALEAVRTGSLSIPDLYQHVLVPLLVDTGARWQRGTTAVWQEHLATATVRGIVEALAGDVSAAAAPANGHTVLLACPSGEQHDLGLRILADRFTLAGWRAVFLGADTPAAEVVSAAIATHSRLVVLSASTHLNLVFLRQFAGEVREGLPPGASIAVGGAAFTSDVEWPPEELLDPDDPALFSPDGGGDR